MRGMARGEVRSGAGVWSLMRRKTAGACPAAARGLAGKSRRRSRGVTRVWREPTGVDDDDDVNEGGVW